MGLMNSPDGKLASRRGRRFRTPRSLSVSVFVLLLAAGGAAAANASTRAGSASARTARSDSTFCQLAAVYSKTNFSPVGNKLSPAVLKSEFGKLKAEEPTMVSLAPKSIKQDLQKVLAFDNLYISEIAKLGWVPAKVPISFDETLGKDAIPLKPASVAVISYEDKACGLKLPIP